MELCKSLNRVILNGRKPGDMFGKVTSIQPNGCSVVDYVVSDYEAFNNIPSLKIGKYSPWLSDHCALHFELSSEEVGGRPSIGTPLLKKRSPFSTYGVRVVGKTF